MPQHQVEIAKQCAAAGQHDPLIDTVGGEFGGGVLERYLGGLDDRADRFGQALGNLTLADHDFLWHAVHQVAPPNLHHAALTVLRHTGGTDLFLDQLCTVLTYEEIFVADHIALDRLDHLVANDHDLKA